MTSQLVLSDERIQALVANYPEWIRNEFDPEGSAELGGGLGQRFPQITMRGKVWRVVDAKGVESVLKDDAGNPLSAVRMVILRGNAHFTRRFFEGAYKEGDANAPDCWSLDNIKPDASVQAKQNPICDTCPKNAWGSKQTENGSRGKACGEYRRLAVVPEWLLTDAEPEVHLFSVPPGSLRALKEFNDMLAKLRLNSWHLVSSVSFNTESLFELAFKPMVVLPDLHAPKIRVLKSSPMVAEVLQVEEDKVRIPGQQAVEPPQEEPPAQAQAPVSPPPPPAPAPAAQAPTPAPAPAPAPAAAQAPAKGRKQGAPIKASPAAAKPAQAPAKPAADPSLGLQLGDLMKGITLPGMSNGEDHQTIEGTAEQADEPDDGAGEEATVAGAGGGELDDLEGLVSAVLKSQS